MRHLADCIPLTSTERIITERTMTRAVNVSISKTERREETRILPSISGTGLANPSVKMHE